jgi:PAS domain S-box-containing protein
MRDSAEKPFPSDPSLPLGAKAVPVPGWRRFSVTAKLTLLVGLAIALLLTLTLTGSWLYWRGVIRKLVETHLNGVATTRSNLVQARVNQLLQRVDLSTDRSEVRAYFFELPNQPTPSKNQEASQLTLKQMVKTRPILTAALVTKEGKVLLSTEPQEVGRDISGYASFQAGLTGPFLGAPYLNGNHYESIVTAPVRTRADPTHIYGVLFTRVDVTSLAETVGDKDNLRSTGEVLLGIPDKGHLQFLFPPRNAPLTTGATLEAAPALREATANQASFASHVDYRGVRVLSAGRPVGYRDWGLVAKMDEREAYEPVFKLLRLEVLFGLAVGALGLGAAYVLARSFTKPVRGLAQAAERVAGGNYGTPVQVTSADEFGALSASFNEMMAAIRTHETQRDHAEQALRAGEERSRQIAESLPQLVWTATADGAWDYVGPQWLEYTGGEAAALLGSGWLERIHPEDRIRVEDRWKAAALAGATFDMQLRIRRHDGTYHWFRARAVPLRDEAGAVVKWFATNTDVDDAHRAEDALREADRRKDEFLAMLGHELRNPLSAITNAARLSQEANDDPAAQALAHHVIDRQTAHLSRLVDDLLDVVRITEGKIELRRSAVDVGEILESAVEAMQPRIKERHHEVVVLLPKNGPLRVDADPMRLEQIVTNLLANAAKYTPDGGRIELSAQREGGDAVITVRDNGVGIAPELLPEIFEIFTQADRSLDRAGGGLGLGLNLCRQLVEIHGGAISAHSEGLGKGAVFTVSLPETAAEPAFVKIVPTPVSTPRGLARRILLVDDNKDTIRLLSRLLTRRGHEVFTADNGLTALKMAHDFQPDAMLLDIGLPGMDGYTLARRLRSSGFPDTLIVAISGYAQDSDRALAREAGFDHHFAKPVDFDALSALLFNEPEAGQRSVG